MTGLALFGLNNLTSAPVAFHKAIACFTEAGDEENAHRMRLNLAATTENLSLALNSIAKLDHLPSALHLVGKLKMGVEHLPQEAVESFERAIELTDESDDEDSTLKLDWLEAILSTPGYNVEFAHQIATSLATNRNTSSKELDYPALSRFAKLNHGEFVSLLKPELVLETKPLYRALYAPWDVKRWAQVEGDAAARTVLALSEQERPADVSIVFQSGLSLLKSLPASSSLSAAIPTTRIPGYWSKSLSHSSLKFKLKHLCPWETI